MAHPKRRNSRQRGRKRRTHYKLTAPTLTACPQCKEVIPPHTVCSNCGTYARREAIAVEEG